MRRNVDRGGGLAYGAHYLVRRHRQRRLFRDLPAKWRRGGRRSHWEEEARLLGHLAHPRRGVAVQTHVGEAPVGGGILLDGVLTPGARSRPALARFLPRARLEP